MIYGERVRLRLPETQSDHELLVKWRNDPGMKLVFYDDEPISLETHMRWWAKVSADSSQRNYMIDAIDTEKPTAIGMTSLVGIDTVNRFAEYGRLKIDAAYQRRGYAYEAEVLLMRHAFDTLNLHRVWLHALAYNEAVIKLHEKTGFRHEGCLRQHIFKHRCYYDVVAMGLLVEEFRQKYEPISMTETD